MTVKKSCMGLLTLMVLFHAYVPGKIIAEEKVKVISEAVDLKLGQQILATIEKGTELKVVARKGDWVGVKFPINGTDQTGWVHQSSVETIESDGLKIEIRTKDGLKTVQIPDLMAFVRIKSLNEVIRKVQEMAMQINPMFAGMISANMVGQAIGNPSLKGVDLNRPFGLAVLDPTKFPEPVVILLPTTDFNAMPKGGMGTMKDFMQLGAYALAGESQKTRAAMSAIAEALPGLQDISLQDMRGEVEIRVDMNQIMIVAGPKIESGLQMMKAGLNQATQSPQGQGQGQGQALNTKTIAAILNAESEWLVDLLNQCQELVFNLGFNSEGIRFTKTVHAKSGTDLEEWFQSMPEAQHQLASILSSDSTVMNMSIESGKNGLLKLYMDLTNKILPAMGLNEDEAKKLEESIRTMTQILDGRMVSSIRVGEKGLHIIYGLGHSGGDTAKETFREAIALFNSSSMNSAYQSLGTPKFFQNLSHRQYKNVEIDVYATPLEIPEGAKNNPIVQQQLKWMKALYGDPILVEIAYLDKMMLFSMGSVAAKGMDQLIDKAQRNENVLPKDLIAAKALFSPKGHLYGAVSFQELITSIEKIIAIYAPNNAAGNVPNILIQGPPLAFFSKASGKQIEVELFVPTKPLAALQAYVMQKVMQMQRPMRQGGNQGAQPTPPMTY